ASEIGIHEQTLNEWLKVFDKPLYSRLFNERKLTFENLYSIMISLGFTESKKILKRGELSNRVNLKSSVLKKNLPELMQVQLDRFIKYPPVFSNQVLKLMDAELLD